MIITKLPPTLPPLFIWIVGAVKSESKEAQEAKEVAALEMKDVVTISEMVEKQLDTYKTLSNDVRILGGTLNQIVQKLKALASKDKTIKTNLISQIQSLNTMTVGASKVLRSYDVKVASAILDYSMKSIKAAQ